MSQKRGKISVIILLLLFLFQYASNNLFFHTHIIDGVKVTHSHPYSSESHQHSRANIDLISNGSRALYIASLFTFISIGILALIYTIYEQTKSIRSESAIVHLIPRAPPV